MSSRFMVVAVIAAFFGAIAGATGYGVNTNNIQKTLKSIVQNPMSIFKPEQEAAIVAQKYGGTHPHGDDPHGDDPHDEIHDPRLPANKDRNFGKAPKDVYGGTVPNDQKPY